MGAETEQQAQSISQFLAEKAVAGDGKGKFNLNLRERAQLSMGTLIFIALSVFLLLLLYFTYGLSRLGLDPAAVVDIGKTGIAALAGLMGSVVGFYFGRGDDRASG